MLYSINSEDYDAKRAEFIQRLSKGEKLFVISSYNTVGAGQNLQYKAPGNATIVAVNDWNISVRRWSYIRILLKRKF